jgi:hypothetical protein
LRINFLVREGAIMKKQSEREGEATEGSLLRDGERAWFMTTSSVFMIGTAGATRRRDGFPFTSLVRFVPFLAARILPLHRW